MCVDAINRYPGGRSSPAGLIIHGMAGVIQIFNRITALGGAAPAINQNCTGDFLAINIDGGLRFDISLGCAQKQPV